MGSGGARNRGGRRLDPESARSEKRHIKLSALPADGYRGRVPTFPLPPRRVYRWESDGKRRYQVLNDEETDLVAERERAMWRWAWRTPQACAWSQPSEAWRLPAIAMWVRTYVLCEASEATAADKNSLHRFADQIGLTPAGLLENRWAIATAPEQVPTRRAAQPATPRRRLRVVPGEDATEAAR